jgi:hypothetical protein
MKGSDMTNHDHLVHAHGHDPAGGGEERFLRRGRWVFWIFVIIAASFLLSEHRAHLLGVLPFLFLLACPLLHLFMHGGHGGHGEHGGDGASTAPGQRPPAESPRETKE